MTNNDNDVDPMDEYYRNKDELARKYPTMRSLAAAMRKFTKGNPPPSTPLHRKVLPDLSSPKVTPRGLKSAKPKAAGSFRLAAKQKKSGSHR